MPEPGQKKTVLPVLASLRGLDDLKQLFWTELNYEQENTPLSDRGWPDASRNALTEAPLLLACGGCSRGRRRATTSAGIFSCVKPVFAESRSRIRSARNSRTNTA